MNKLPDEQAVKTGPDAEVKQQHTLLEFKAGFI
jgi:hypothetical protein